MEFLPDVRFGVKRFERGAGNGGAHGWRSRYPFLMEPYFGPDREETVRRLRERMVHLPITLGNGAPAFRIDCRDGMWLLAPLVMDAEAAMRMEETQDSGIWRWDFQAEGEPIFASRSRIGRRSAG